MNLHPSPPPQTKTASSRQRFLDTLDFKAVAKPWVRWGAFLWDETVERWKREGWDGAPLDWYVGFMLYGMGTTFMGKYDFTSWSIHLAFVIVFSTICGILAREWRGVSQRTAWLVAVAMLVLVISTFVIAVGNRLASP